MMGIDSTIGWFQIELLKHPTERNLKSGRGKGRSLFSRLSCVCLVKKSPVKLRAFPLSGAHPSLPSFLSLEAKKGRSWFLVPSNRLSSFYNQHLSNFQIYSHHQC